MADTKRQNGWWACLSCCFSKNSSSTYWQEAYSLSLLLLLQSKNSYFAHDTYQQEVWRT